MNKFNDLQILFVLLVSAAIIGLLVYAFFALTGL